MRVAALSSTRVAGHGVRPTKIGSALAAILAATVAAGALLVHGPHSAAAGPSWQSGVYVGGCNTTAINQFKSFRGGNIAHGMVFLGTSWASIQNPTSAANCFKSMGVPVTFSVPMLPSSGANISTGATGAYNSHWSTLARNLVSSGQANADLRIGWEMNGGWFNWSARSNPTAWKNYWIQIVKSMRSVSGQHFTFTWSPANGQSFAVENAYPGDAYVDYIGASVYDEDYSSKSQTGRWNAILNGSHGLNWQASFAAAHGKKMSFPEWALATPSSFSGHGGGDDPYFIQQFYNFLKSHNVAYETYFDSDHSPNVHKINSGTGPSGNFRNAAATYRALWSGVSAPPVTTQSSTTAKPSSSSTPKPSSTPSATVTAKPSSSSPASTPPTTSSSNAKDALLFSTSANRSTPHLLNGATVSGYAAVWVTPSAGAKFVTFSIDKRVLRVEKNLPFDMAGTYYANARLYDFAGLAKGKHTLTAVIALNTGATKTVTASFTR
jgi:Glycosyl hydrolase family 26